MEEVRRQSPGRAQPDGTPRNDSGGMRRTSSEILSLWVAPQRGPGLTQSLGGGRLVTRLRWGIPTASGRSSSSLRAPYKALTRTRPRYTIPAAGGPIRRLAGQCRGEPRASSPPRPCQSGELPVHPSSDRVVEIAILKVIPTGATTFPASGRTPESPSQRKRRRFMASLTRTSRARPTFTDLRPWPEWLPRGLCHRGVLCLAHPSRPTMRAAWGDGVELGYKVGYSKTLRVPSSRRKRPTSDIILGVPR